MTDPQLAMKLSNANLSDLFTHYGSREESGLADDVNACAALAQRALSLGEPLLAYDACGFGLQAQAGHARLGQLQGLALARCGASDQARQVLERLYEQGAHDEETIGILARVHKDLWQESADAAQAKASLDRSLALYLEAYRLAGGYWLGINAATLALASGDAGLSMQLAQKNHAQCLEEESKASSPDKWRRATLGEAALLLGQLDEAKSWYARALDAGAGFGDRGSMRRNVLLILAARGMDATWSDQVLPRPVIATFSGHMPDGRARPSSRFPEAAAAGAGKAIKAWIKNANVQIGYASGACGGDILFHEAMIELGRETHVVLPETPARFARGSVVEGDGNWARRYQNVLDRAASVVVHADSASGEIGYTYNNWMILGLARARARQIDGRVKAFALWDGNTGPQGGTSSAVRDWHAFGENVDWLAPDKAATSAWRQVADDTARGAVVRGVGSQRIVSMLFADAVGFSKLPDESIPAFVEHFLGAVARTLDAQFEQALTRNTWGDGLYFCFATPRAAGQFALDLCDAIRNTDWTVHGLPATLSLRVALHCGPAHEVIDPVIRLRNYTGAHVSRAARIEPITPPGSVYSSQSFAALCECEQIREFACEYVGRMPLAKKFGEYPTYSVRRRK